MITWPLFFVLPSFNSLQRWHDVCLNTPFAVQEVLFAWEHMALPVEKVKVRNFGGIYLFLFFNSFLMEFVNELHFVLEHLATLCR